MTQQPGHLMHSEISEQPAVFERVLASHKEIAQVAQVVSRSRPRMVLFAARGTSDNAATYGRYIVETDLGLPTGLMAPSTMTLYGANLDLRGALVIAVSQSGGSPDLAEVAKRAAVGGALVLAITNSPESPLAQAAALHLNIHAGPELAVAATKSYTAQMLVLRLLVNALSEQSTAGIDELPLAAAQIVANQTQWSAVSKDLANTNRLVVTARGFSLATAQEAALKIMETSYISAMAFSGADLLHGPMAMVDNNHPVVAVVPDGIAAHSMQPVLERLAQATNTLVVVGADQAGQFATHHMRVAHGLPECLSPMLDIIALQFMIWQLAVNAGHDPDAPRGLLKVTKTL